MSDVHHNLQAFVKFTSDQDVDKEKLTQLLEEVSKWEEVVIKTLIIEGGNLILMIQIPPQVALKSLLDLLQYKSIHPWHPEYYYIWDTSSSDEIREFLKLPEDPK